MECEEETKRKKAYSNHWFTFPNSHTARIGPGQKQKQEVKSSEPTSGLMPRWQGQLAHGCSFQQGAGSEVELLGQELVPRWDVNITMTGFAHYAKAPSSV